LTVTRRKQRAAHVTAIVESVEKPPAIEFRKNRQENDLLKCAVSNAITPGRDRETPGIDLLRIMAGFFYRLVGRHR
jgi:hypothetical protein